MADIVIIGGGVMGSSAAYHLAMAGAADRVVVVEPDPTYEFASTPRSSGGVRSLHGIAENVQMTLYSHQVYGNFPALMAVDGQPGYVGWRNHGYLNLAAGADAVRVMEADWKVQRAEGADVILLERDGLAQRFPSLNVSDVDLGALALCDGSLDPYAALMGFRKKAQSLGVRYIKDKVVGIEQSGRRIAAVRLASGERLTGDLFANMAGAWAPEICDMVGMRLPVEPMRRLTFFFECRDAVEVLPTTRDWTGISVRPEGTGFIVGVTNKAEPGGWNWDVDHGWFDDVIWPRLAHRVPKFESIKLGRSWSGHYAQNRLDGNIIIGRWDEGPSNFYVFTGCSGAGLQKAPSIGRAMKELLLDGGYQTIDLTRFSYRRVVDNEPIREYGLTA
ncbi:MAG: NAD(P)/FAD-dependent oxidoreductase [Alphaproteobacteria bacterium]